MQKDVVLNNGEIVILSEKPKKTAFIMKNSLKMLPIAVIWFAIDFGFISASVQEGEMLWFLIPFFTLHLMPVWIWLANAVTANRRWKNTRYFVTNKRIIIQSGFFAINEVSLFYKDLHNAQLNIGLLGKLFHTGSIIFDAGAKENNFVFEDLENCEQIYSRVQNIILDIQTDMEYPNALRPEINEGYKTDYREF
ncbi:MAG: PH domain-containing protein [Clostridia bacterium]|nr:PH domain-containing protein [Clostridia bacterium]